MAKFRETKQEERVEVKPEISHIEQEVKNLITLNEYLANYNYSGNRNLDTPITLWYQKQDPMNMKREKEEWDNIIKKFLAE